MNKIIQIGNLRQDQTERKNPSAGRVYDVGGVSPTLSCMGGGQRQPYIVEPTTIIDDTQGFDGVRVYEDVPTLRAESHGNLPIVINPEDRIRRLTPRECWRLFDFTDDDFNKADAVNSDTQLYKQAGNSIIVNVLMAAISKLHITGHVEVLELFGGIGAPRKALTNLGIDFHTADYVEIDKYAVKSYNALYGENYEVQDVTKWDKDMQVDMIFHGSPCQDFSVAGLGKGGDEGSGTRSSLMFESVRIINKHKPKYVIWENVKGAISPKHKHNFDKYIRTMDALGYNTYWQIMNGVDYGTPQSRERIIAISIRKDIDMEYEFPKPIPLTKTIADILEDNVDEKYYVKQELTERLIEQIKAKQVSNTVRGGGRGSIDRHSWDLVVG